MEIVLLDTWQDYMSERGDGLNEEFLETKRYLKRLGWAAGRGEERDASARRKVWMWTHLLGLLDMAKIDCQKRITL